MPQSAIVLLIIGGIVILAGIVFSVINFKNVKQYLKKEIGGHTIEIKTGFRTAELVVDGKVIDQFSVINSSGIKLTGKFGKNEISVNIGGGFVKPRIITFINGEKDIKLSNV